eukprot:Lithocolla_globosa_v1_NODE_3515_length_1651_cov_3.700501.p2 type:complete len:100 gc:universal NODE_3515_length_1651_cov_3.700501:1121-822(-)
MKGSMAIWWVVPLSVLLIRNNSFLGSESGRLEPGGPRKTTTLPMPSFFLSSTDASNRLTKTKVSPAVVGKGSGGPIDISSWSWSILPIRLIWVRKSAGW